MEDLPRTPGLGVPGSDAIVYASGIWPSQTLWRIQSSRPSQPEPLLYTGEGASAPAISNDGRLVFSRSLAEGNIWRVPLGDAAETLPQKWIASSRFDWLPQFSPGGNHIVFSSNRTGSEELWICDRKGDNATPLTAFGSSHSGAAAWAPKGGWVAFHSCFSGTCDIFVIDSQFCVAQGLSCRGSPECMRQVTYSKFDDFMPSWSRDGRWIYFASARGGSVEIWKTGAEGGEPVQVTHSGGLYAQESLDGSLLYFTKWHSKGIWLMDRATQKETLLIPEAHHRFELAQSGLYYIAGKSNRAFSVHHYDTASGQHQKLADVKRRFAWSLSVAPDESALLWAQFDREEADLVLVDGFH